LKELDKSVNLPGTKTAKMSKRAISQGVFVSLASKEINNKNAPLVRKSLKYKFTYDLFFWQNAEEGRLVQTADIKLKEIVPQATNTLENANRVFLDFVYQNAQQVCWIFERF